MAQGPGSQISSTPAPQSLWWVLPAWLIPGLGWWARGRNGRGWAQFFMVLITFAVGIRLHGGVAWPSWSMSDPDFNLINNITLVIQLGAGLPALVSLAASHLAASQPQWSLLGGVPQNPYYELGSYYLIVAGAVNYFAVCNLSDRLLRPTARFLPEATTEVAKNPASPTPAKLDQSS